MESTPAGVLIAGSRVRELRKLAGLSVSDLAAVIGVTPSYVSLFERGGRERVSPRVFVKICDALGIGAEDRSSLVLPVARVSVPPRPRSPRGAAVPAVTQ